MKKLILGALLSSISMFSIAQKITITVTYDDNKTIVYKYKDFNAYLSKRACYVTEMDKEQDLVVISFQQKRKIYEYELPYKDNVNIGDTYIAMELRSVDDSKQWSNFSSYEKEKKWYLDSQKNKLNNL